ncbi:MAG: hypothetical protein ACK45X_08345, partial [Roseiflexaceae bacterium]
PCGRHVIAPAPCAGAEGRLRPTHAPTPAPVIPWRQRRRGIPSVLGHMPAGVGGVQSTMV